jgi:hypothetical protein
MGKSLLSCKLILHHHHRYPYVYQQLFQVGTYSFIEAHDCVEGVPNFDAAIQFSEVTPLS